VATLWCPRLAKWRCQSRQVPKLDSSIRTEEDRNGRSKRRLQNQLFPTEELGPLRVVIDPTCVGLLLDAGQSMRRGQMPYNRTQINLECVRALDIEEEETMEGTGWRSCWPTADETTISFCCPLDTGGPWLAGRALDTLRAAGRVEADSSRPRYVTGTRRGAPLILGEPLLWHNQPVVLEACQTDRQPTGEVTIRLPPWSELAKAVSEDELWELADALAEEFGAVCGIVSDGRAIGYPDLERPQRTAARLQTNHLGVMIPREWVHFLRQGSDGYQLLPRSELWVVLE